MGPKPGERVFALLSASRKEIEFLGFGVYLCDEVPPHEIGGSLNDGRKNPKIQLDDGEIVWGCECWWGPEKEYQPMTIPPKITKVSIVEYRLRIKNRRSG